MASIGKRLLCACAVLAFAPVCAAKAGILEITGAGIYSSNKLDVNGSNYYATALDLTIQGSASPLFVFCVDINHVIYVRIGSQLGYSPPLQYITGPVNTDSSGPTSGTGNPLSQTVSGEIQTLANLGVGIAKSSGAPTSWSATTQDELTAVQGAIWETEFGFTPSQVVGTAAQNVLIADYVAFAGTHSTPGYARGLYPTGGTAQGFGYSQGQVTAVPESSTWAMMLLGFAGLGFAGYRGKAQGRASSFAM